MNSWSQNQNQNNMTMGQAQFMPYQQPNLWGNYSSQPQRLPIYHAEPIHGENAAWAFPMGPNSEIWLPDADRDLVWWIRTDMNGNKTVTPFDVKPHEEPKQIDMEEILARLGAVEEWINGKQNKSNAKRSATVSTNTTSPTSASAE